MKFSKSSLEKLSSCHSDLQLIAHELIKVMDVAVICGHRNEKDQLSAFINGKSKLTWPKSKHNKTPSEAMDIVPYPIDWNNIPTFIKMCKHVEEIADRLGIKIRLGRDFSFKDYPHVELHDKHKKS